MDPIKQFEQERTRNVARMARDKVLAAHVRGFLTHSFAHKYSYNFDWLGLPIIQYPQDILAMQELIWRVKPDLIIETGIARGGSLIFYASLLNLIGRGGQVVGVDVDIRKHNRRAVERHPLARRITMLEGSSTDPRILRRIRAIAKKHRRVMVCLDSLHTHEHVLEELMCYASLVSVGSYLVVFDTIVAELPDTFWKERPWSKRKNPKTALDTFIRSNRNFVVDRSIDTKLLITVARGGFLKKVRR